MSAEASVRRLPRRRKVAGMRAARRWRRGFLAAVGLCAVVFTLDASFGEVRPGSVWGLSYGTAAAVLCLVAAAYGVRRRAMRLATKAGFGRSRTWLYLHVYGGALFAILVLMHSGFRVPTGALNTWLWALALWMAASGLGGLALQQWIPRVLASGLATEVHYDRIPELSAEIRAQAERLAGGAGEAVRALYDRRIAPALAAPRRRLFYFLDITGGIHGRLKEFEYLFELMEEDELHRLRELQRLYRTKLEIDAHYTLQPALRVWLWTHVPVSLAVLALLAIHVFTVVYY